MPELRELSGADDLKSPSSEVLQRAPHVQTKQLNLVEFGHSPCKRVGGSLSSSHLAWGCRVARFEQRGGAKPRLPNRNKVPLGGGGRL